MILTEKMMVYWMVDLKGERKVNSKACSLVFLTEMKTVVLMVWELVVPMVWELVALMG